MNELSPILWPHRPNWRDTVKMQIAYKTEMILTRTGKEQRRALRTSPRLNLSFTSSLLFDEHRRLVMLLAARQNQPLWMPDFSRQAKTGAELDLGDNAVQIIGPPTWLAVGAKVAFVGLDALAEVLVVESVAGDVATFETNAINKWPAGSKVYPAMTGVLSGGLKEKRLTKRIGEFAVEFDVDPGSEPEYTPPAAPVSFAGREVFTVEPNWLEAPDIQYDWETQDIDYDSGVIRRHRPVEFGSQTIEAGFFGQGRAEVTSILDVFHRAKGRRGEFYYPTFAADIPLEGVAFSGGHTFATPGTEVAAAYGTSTVFKAIAIYLADGSVLYRTVNSITPSSGSSVFSCSGSWPFNLNQNNVVKISWMPVCRFGSDQLSVEWLTDSKARLRLAIVTLEALAAE